ncbi:hypothetical protein [Haladaptatus sp. ZSTT2]|uniref:hypothetical protein n=1 Tax=Haladaptatus sp. ZSTT2 TaxID=3120515 RepID=UPI00300F32FE
MSSNQSLPTTIEALETKAREHKQAQNTQFHVSVARTNIRELNRELDSLATSLSDLQYYTAVLEGAFDESAPTMVRTAVTQAKKAVAVTQDTLLTNLQSGEFAEEAALPSDDGYDSDELTPEVKTQISKIQSAKTQVDDVTNTIVDQLEKEAKSWKTKVTAAEELQKIIGGKNTDFARTLTHLQKLLRNQLLDPSGSASNFVDQWGNATSNWEEYQSLQSFDDFQAKHNLSKSTIEDIKKLSKSKRLTLADVSLDSLTEMKNVPELESAVELSL